MQMKEERRPKKIQHTKMEGKDNRKTQNQIDRTN
jgi:hypothetical protein